MEETGVVEPAALPVAEVALAVRLFPELDFQISQDKPELAEVTVEQARVVMVAQEQVQQNPRVLMVSLAETVDTDLVTTTEVTLLRVQQVAQEWPQKI